MSIESRVPRADYDAVNAMNITRLKEIRRSPQHYQYALTHPKKSDALTLGIATHVAVLEPERFDSDFAIWTRRTDAGAMSPRRGQFWEDFCAMHPGRTILTPDEGNLAKNIAAAVRTNPLALKYLGAGEPEVTMEWDLDGRPCKGRVDWITHIDGKPVIVGLKTTRDCRHFVFGAQAAKLGYHLQWAWYFEGFKSVKSVPPHMVEIVVESAPPHAVAVYAISDDIIAQGWDECQRCLTALAGCELVNEWPGPVPVEEPLTLPSWAYQAEDDDVGDLGLEGFT
jgi:hypothetical protein